MNNTQRLIPHVPLKKRVGRGDREGRQSRRMRLEQLKGNLEGQIRAVTGSGNTRQTSLLFAPPRPCAQYSDPGGSNWVMQAPCMRLDGFALVPPGKIIARILFQSRLTDHPGSNLVCAQRPSCPPASSKVPPFDGLLQPRATTTRTGPIEPAIRGIPYQTENARALED
jgi:hypothetical protein